MAARPPRPAADRGADVSEAGASSGSLPLDGLPLLGAGGGGAPGGDGGGGGGGSSLVAHVVVVGFHASLGNRIEFAYPPLRGCITLRSPRLSDTWDIGAEPTDAAAAAAAATVGGGLGGRGSPFEATTTPPGSGEGGGGAPAPLSVAASGGASVVVETRGSWGALPPEWSFLPFMALPDGVHEETAASVFFVLPGGVHAVAAFRQADAADTRNSSASAGAPAGGRGRPSSLGGGGGGCGGGGASGGGSLGGHPGRPGVALGDGSDGGGGDADEAAAAAAAATAAAVDASTAARGSIQKSVVLLCRRPLYGAVSARLGPAVKAYFAQRDFARTAVLAELFHAINAAFPLHRPPARASGAVPRGVGSVVDTALGAASEPLLFMGLHLRRLVRCLGTHLLTVVKLVLLERRTVLYGRPVSAASAAVVAVASLFSGGLDALSDVGGGGGCGTSFDADDVTGAFFGEPPPPLETPSAADTIAGCPLDLFSSLDRVAVQPYAPLPVVQRILRARGSACLVATSANVATLLTSTAEAAAAAAVAAASATAAAGGGSSGVVAAPLLASAAAPGSRPRTAAGALTASVSAAAGPAVGGSVTGGRGGAAAGAPGGAGGRRFAPSRSAPASVQGGAGDRGRPSPPAVVDALFDVVTGAAWLSPNVTPLVRLSRQERRFCYDLVAAAHGYDAGRRDVVPLAVGGKAAVAAAAAGPLPEPGGQEVSGGGGGGGAAAAAAAAAVPAVRVIGSDAYLRSRLRAYVRAFLTAVASSADLAPVLAHAAAEGGAVGERGGRLRPLLRRSDAAAATLPAVAAGGFSVPTARGWLSTRNAALWARRVHLPLASPAGGGGGGGGGVDGVADGRGHGAGAVAAAAAVPAPHVDVSLLEAALPPTALAHVAADRLAAGVAALRQTYLGPPPGDGGGGGNGVDARAASAREATGDRAAAAGDALNPVTAAAAAALPVAGVLHGVSVTASRAVEGIGSFFRSVEREMSRLETAVTAAAAPPQGPPPPPPQGQPPPPPQASTVNNGRAPAQPPPPGA